MSLDLFAEFYRKNSAEYKLAKKLHEFTGKDPECGNGLRWLADDDNTIEYWFDGDADTALNFYTIAATPSAGLFAVWMRDKVERKKMPFVFLGAEGDAHVIAADFASFLSLIALPYEDIEFAFSRQIFEFHSKPSKKFVQFRKWLSEECNVQPAEAPEAIVEAAQAKHPSLQEFVENWADSWFPRKNAK